MLGQCAGMMLCFCAKVMSANCARMMLCFCVTVMPSQCARMMVCFCAAMKLGQCAKIMLCFCATLMPSQCATMMLCYCAKSKQYIIDFFVIQLRLKNKTKYYFHAMIKSISRWSKLGPRWRPFDVLTTLSITYTRTSRIERKSNVHTELAWSNAKVRICARGTLYAGHEY